MEAIATGEVQGAERIMVLPVLTASLLASGQINQCASKMMLLLSIMF